MRQISVHQNTGYPIYLLDNGMYRLHDRDFNSLSEAISYGDALYFSWR